MAHDYHKNLRVTTAEARRPAARRFLPVVACFLFRPSCSRLRLAPTARRRTPTDLPESSDLEAAPDFEFTLYQGEGELGGSELSMSELQGKPVVLNFWAGLCPPCRAEMPDFQAFQDENRDRLTVLGIDVGQFTNLGTQEDARLLLTDLGVTYPAGYTDRRHHHAPVRGARHADHGVHKLPRRGVPQLGRDPGPREAAGDSRRDARPEETG